MSPGRVGAVVWDTIRTGASGWALHIGLAPWGFGADETYLGMGKKKCYVISWQILCCHGFSLQKKSILMLPGNLIYQTPDPNNYLEKK